MLNILCRILAAILKMADISKILKTLPFSKWRPKYGIKYSTLSDIIEI
jgi:hypothetical protein